MTKFFNILLIFVTVSLSAQVTLSAKANLLFPTGSPSWDNLSSTAVNAYNEKGENNVGFNVGLSLKISTPTSFFIMPEIYYTNFKNEFTDDNKSVTLEAKSQRIDLPVLLGYNIVGNKLGIFAGPVASYNLSTNNQFDDFTENVKNEFSVGYQFGLQVQLSKLIVNARYEGAFSEDERTFIENNSSYVVRYDNRPSLFIVGLGYQF